MLVQSFMRFVVLLYLLFFSFEAISVERFNMPLFDDDVEESILIESQVRLKDIVHFEGIRDNLLMGYGLVVGLNGTGDNLKNSIFTKQELDVFLGKLGLNSRGANIKSQSIAAVTVTATMPPFAGLGSRIDVKASTLGDAKSLSGGVLLPTSLFGPDGNVYAVAQGDISGSVDSKSKRSNKVIKTNAIIQYGGLIEKEIDFDLNNVKNIKMSLYNPDISTAYRIASRINDVIFPDIAQARDPSTVFVEILPEYRNNVMGLLSQLELIQVSPDSTAKIIVNESSGSIVVDKNVKISRIAISHAGVSIDIEDNVVLLDRADTTRDLVDGLNSLGVSTSDLIDILYSIKNVGALHGKVVVQNG